MFAADECVSVIESKQATGDILVKRSRAWPRESDARYSRVFTWPNQPDTIAPRQNKRHPDTPARYRLRNILIATLPPA